MLGEAEDSCAENAADPFWTHQRSATPPRKALIIWDWDDTLLCTSALDNQQCHPGALNELEALLGQVLAVSMGLGETVIVTNAGVEWVSGTAHRFLPRILPLLERLVVVSARHRHESAFPKDTFAWKREAFRELLGVGSSPRHKELKRCHSLDRLDRDLNMVAIGDSPAEMVAAHAATLDLIEKGGSGSTPLIKTVKFKAKPSMDELLEQLRIVALELPKIAADGWSGNRFFGAGAAAWQ